MAGNAKHWNRKVIQRWKRKIRNIRKEGRKSLEESPNQHSTYIDIQFNLVNLALLLSMFYFMASKDKAMNWYLEVIQHRVGSTF